MMTGYSVGKTLSRKFPGQMGNGYSIVINNPAQPENYRIIWHSDIMGRDKPTEQEILDWLDEMRSQELADAKAVRKAEIDANTIRIRDRDGLSYSGERFAMNEGAKLNWTGMAVMAASLTYPFTILTLDDRPFDLANQAELMRFLNAAMSYDTAPGSPVTSGRALRMRVEAATTMEEVEAIVDDRE